MDGWMDAPTRSGAKGRAIDVDVDVDVDVDSTTTWGEGGLGWV